MTDFRRQTWLRAFVICASFISIVFFDGRNLQRTTAAEERVLKFPTDRSLGTLMSRPPQAEKNGRWPNYEAWESLGAAQGPVRIPDGHQVRLDVGVKAVADLSPLGKLPPDALVTIRIEDAEMKDEQLRHIGRLTGLIELSIESSTITDAGLKHLSNLHQLRELDLDAYGVWEEGFGPGDAGAQVLSRLKSLQRIGLRHARLTDLGLAHLARMKTLRSLELAGTRITDAGLGSLSKTESLEVLSLGVYDEGCSVTDTGIARLAELPKLRWLRLDGTGLTDKGLAALSRLQRLEYLTMGGTKITVRGLEGLSTLTRLETIEVPFDIDDRAAKALAKLPSLRRIRSNLSEITDEGLNALAELDNLQWFDISSEFVTDEGMRAVGRMKNLKLLGLYNARVTDVGFEHLRSLRNLEILRIRLPQFQGPGLQYLAALPNLTDVRLNLDNEHGSTEPPNEVDLSSLNSLQTITDLTLNGDRLRRQHIAGAFELSRLKSLRIDFPINDQDVERLSGITTLKHFEIDDRNGSSEVTDEGMRFLARLPQLRWLSMSGVFSDHGLLALSQVKTLETLYLGSPFLTPQGIDRLQESLPNLTRFGRMRMGRDESTLAVVRLAVAQLDDVEPVLKELDRIDVSLNPEDLIFRDGSRDKLKRVSRLEGKPALSNAGSMTERRWRS